MNEVTWVEETGQMQYTARLDDGAVWLSGVNLNDGTEWAHEQPSRDPLALQQFAQQLVAAVLPDFVVAPKRRQPLDVRLDEIRYDDELIAKVLNAFQGLDVYVDATEWDLGDDYDDIPWDGQGVVKEALEGDSTHGGWLFVDFNDGVYEAVIPFHAIRAITL